ncbi:MAG: PAS domain-containing protein [Thalassobaculum sp.]|uniref:PAS domain-containing protein n=1 Tax=Thalassobaculum sp. TaxID=2022740 RepID=UPI0032EF72A2
MNQAPRFRASISDPGLAGLYDLWDRLRRRLGRLPHRREIDPTELPREVLPGMLVLEREPSGRFRCRLAGTKLTEIYGFEPTGWYLDQVMPPEPAAFRLAMYEEVLREQRAVFCRLRFAVPGREIIASDRLYLPVLGDISNRPTVLYGAQRFLYATEVAGEPDEHGVYHLCYDDPAVG